MCLGALSGPWEFCRILRGGGGSPKSYLGKTLDVVMVMVVKVIMKLTVVMEMVLDKEVNMEVNQEVYKKVAKDADKKVVEKLDEVYLFKSVSLNRPSHRGQYKRCCCI